MKKIRYLLFAGGIPNQWKSTDLVQSGLYCWPHAFNRGGSYGYASPSLDPEFLQGFDIIHVNYVPSNISAIMSLHDAIKNSGTKLIMNMDYSIAMQASIDPHWLAHCAGLVDFIFHVEPMGAELMSYYLNRPVHVNPHPCCVELLSSKFRSGEDYVPTVMCQYHRYQYTWAIYYYAMLKARRDKAFKSVLANYIPGSIGQSIEWFFDDVVKYCEYPEFIPYLSRTYLNMDIPPDFVGGRGVVDAAALGIPTIGSTTSYSQNLIWPELAVDPYDFKSASVLLDLFREDFVFYGEMVHQGVERSKQFGLDASRSRLIRMLEEENVI